MFDGAVDNSDVDVRTDTDGDGVSDLVERAVGDRDSDGDGIPDYQDPDDDGDGIPTKDEGMLDSDNDGASNYIDADDDGDGVSTKDELAAAGGSTTKDKDGDGVPDYLDNDALVEQDAGTVKECAQTSAAADLRKKPVDIVFVIDNSSSMSAEAKAVGDSINADFAKVIGASGIDYRVIMLADFGHYNSPTTDAHSICVSGELNPGQTCPTSNMDAVYGKAPVNSARYFHYDADGAPHDKNKSVGSLNSMCRALEWYNKADGFGLAPNGWSKWLRKDASKVFVEITDDHAKCNLTLGSTNFSVDDSMGDPADTAKKFDSALRGLSSEMFGSETARNYVFHSIVSMPYKAGAMHDTPYEPTEPVAGANCSSGENPGRGYEAMSRMTGGLRYPICAADDATSGVAGFTAVFKKIAQGVVEGTKVACDFAVPAAPDGKTLDRDTVEVVYSQSGKDPISFRKVQDVESCGGQAGSFYFRNDTILLCSDTCTRVQSDSTAKVDVRFGCKLPPRKEPPPLPPPPVPQ